MTEDKLENSQNKKFFFPKIYRNEDNRQLNKSQLRSELSYTWVNGHQIKFHGSKKYPLKTVILIQPQSE